MQALMKKISLFLLGIIIIPGNNFSFVFGVELNPVISLNKPVPPHNNNSPLKLSQFGITWEFDKDYQHGNFANGDYWVVGPIRITGINPSSADVNGIIKNGSQINPSPKDEGQGYDNHMPANIYNPNLNVAFNLSSSNPLTVPANSSLVSSISKDGLNNIPQLKTMAVLTVLDVAPPEGSFRPGYAGASKEIKYNKNQLDYSVLKNLAPVAGTPQLSAVERYFEKPWIDYIPGWIATGFFPSDNMPGYGRDISLKTGDAALMLNLNFTNEQKEKLLIEYVQLGIDLASVAQSGGGWQNDGGHASGRKMPILLAGMVLHDNNLKSIVNSGKTRFGEDDQTFYVTQKDVDITHSSSWRPDSRDIVAMPYDVSDIGLAEWGIRHFDYPEMSNKYWPTQYRECCTANSWAGEVLAALIMDAKGLWNHNALFDYMDRYMSKEPGIYRQWSAFAQNMWDSYRGNYGVANN